MENFAIFGGQENNLSLWWKFKWWLLGATSIIILVTAYLTGFLAFLHYAFFPGREWYTFSRQNDPRNPEVAQMDGIVLGIGKAKIWLWSAKIIQVFTISPETDIRFSILKRKRDKWLASGRLQDLVSEGILVKRRFAPIQGVIVIGEVQEEKLPLVIGDTYLLSDATFDQQNLLHLFRTGDIVQLHLEKNKLKSITVKKLTYGL